MAGSVLPTSAKCAVCDSGDVDTQLKPCGHFFKGTCLRSKLQEINKEGGETEGGETIMKCPKCGER